MVKNDFLFWSFFLDIIFCVFVIRRVVIDVIIFCVGEFFVDVWFDCFGFGVLEF